MEPLYKVGDKVKVIARKAKVSDYRFGFIDTMCVYAGQIVTIAAVRTSPKSGTFQDDGYLYKILEDKEIYSWASSMFRPLVASTTSQSNDTPMTIKVRTNQPKFNFKN